MTNPVFYLLTLASSQLMSLPNYVVDDKTAIWLVYPKSNVLTAKKRVFIDLLIEKIGVTPPWEQSIHPIPVV